MKKMIGVINDNLHSVVNGIKEHRKEAEKNLAVIKSEIDLKVEAATKYKTDVETSRTIITSLETEISELETDLKELTEKFASKNFKEILAAGDKEINSKIAEKKNLIMEQNAVIATITKKAHSLKRDLSKLKDKRVAIEEDLNKTLILEGYYEKRINAIIDFSVEHPEELATYKEIDEVDDLNTEEIEDIDIENIIDGQVFNEIDSISEGSMRIPSDGIETPEVDDAKVDLNRIDSIMNVANEIIDKNESVEETEEEVSESEQELMSAVALIEADDTLEDKPLNKELEDEPTKEHIEIHSMSEPITVNLDVLGGYNVENISDDLIFKNTNMTLEEELSECGLSSDNFDPNELGLLENHFDKQNTIDFIEVLKKHGIDINKIYTSIRVLIDVTPANLDHILTLLEGISTKEDIDYVFRYLDKVNVSKLEQNINSMEDANLTELLIDTLSSESSADLANLLGISNKEADIIKKGSPDDYRLMINFPEIVLANYNALKSYNIDNLKDCIIRYPHRFTFNPSRFMAILDKYDADDLVRCINKNSAVIEKL